MILFLHDDVYINDILLFDKLLAAKKNRNLDVVGVAGAKGYQIPNPNQPTGWWSPPNSQFGFAGSVVHKDKERGIYLTTSYGPAPQRVLVIDGCFIAVMRSAIDAGLRFNTNYKFDFYDIAFCLDAYKKNLKVGVEPILITHGSPGRGFLSPTFMQAQQQFVKEYFSQS